MIPNSTSPTMIRTMDAQLENLYQRRSAVDRLIRSLEHYQRCQPARVSGKKQRVA